MLLCYICGGDATKSGTQCLICLRFIDVKCHGGVIGDGFIIRRACFCKYLKIIYDTYLGLLHMHLSHTFANFQKLVESIQDMEFHCHKRQFCFLMSYELFHACLSKILNFRISLSGSC